MLDPCGTNHITIGDAGNTGRFHIMMHDIIAGLAAGCKLWWFGTVYSGSILEQRSNWTSTARVATRIESLNSEHPSQLRCWFWRVFNLVFVSQNIWRGLQWCDRDKLANRKRQFFLLEAHKAHVKASDLSFAVFGGNCTRLFQCWSVQWIMITLLCCCSCLSYWDVVIFLLLLQRDSPSWHMMAPANCILRMWMEVAPMWQLPDLPICIQSTPPWLTPSTSTSAHLHSRQGQPLRDLYPLFTFWIRTKHIVIIQKQSVQTACMASMPAWVLHGTVKMSGNWYLFGIYLRIILFERLEPLWSSQSHVSFWNLLHSCKLLKSSALCSVKVHTWTSVIRFFSWLRLPDLSHDAVTQALIALWFLWWI